MFKMLLTTLCLVSGLIFGETYYVSSSSGDDSNNGTSQSSPWKTLNKVNSFNFQPGDIILLRRGDVWNDILNINNSGTENNYILFGAYHSGSKPIISAGTSSQYSLKISGNYIKIEELEIIMPRSGSVPIGISVQGKNYVIQNCDINGDENYNGGKTIGISAKNSGSIINCIVQYFGEGIETLYENTSTPIKVIIKDNIIKETRPLGYSGGDGI